FSFSKSETFTNSCLIRIPPPHIKFWIFPIPTDQIQFLCPSSLASMQHNNFFDNFPIHTIFLFLHPKQSPPFLICANGFLYYCFFFIFFFFFFFFFVFFFFFSYFFFFFFLLP